MVTRIPDSITAPSDWSEQLAIWTAERGQNWREKLDRWVKKRRNLREFPWNAQRFYEVVFFWDDHDATSVAIARWWIEHRVMEPAKIPDKNGHDDRRGIVDGMVRRMQDFGLLRQRDRYPAPRIRASIDGKKMLHSNREQQQQEPKPRSRHSEIMEIRMRRVLKSGGSFDTLSRAERGMPPPELAQQQHPDYPLGVTYDAAYRIEHGRTSIFSEADRKRLAVSRRFSDIIAGLTKFADECPTVAEYLSLRYTEKDLIRHGIRKVLPELKILIKILEELPEPEPDRAADMPDHESWTESGSL